jgi:hypothetical protein
MFTYFLSNRQAEVYDYNGLQQANTLFLQGNLPAATQILKEGLSLLQIHPTYQLLFCFYGF